MIYTIQSSFTVNDHPFTANIEYYDEVSEAKVGLRGWATRHGATERLSNDGMFFDYWNGRQNTSFLIVEIETEN